MSGFTFQPGSSILDRVRLFLPQIEKANQDLNDQILVSGSESVRIDTFLEHSAPESEKLETSEKSEDSECMENNEEEDVSSSSESIESQSTPVIQLSFALGDFDGSLMAEADDEKDNLDEEIVEGQNEKELPVESESPESVDPPLSTTETKKKKQKKQNKSSKTKNKPLIQELP